MKSVRALVFVLLTGALLGSSCKQVLSIEDAELDPSLGGTAGVGGDAGHDHGGASGNSGTSGAGGSGGAAGDSGSDGSFPTLCHRYCATVAANCTGEHEVFEDDIVCMATCNALPAGQEGDRGMNSVHCRLAAAEQARLIEKEFYCPRAGPGGEAPDDTNPCGTNCDNWCALMATVCNDPRWYSAATCMSECAGVPDLGTFSTASEKGQARGHSVQCRLIHVANSTLEPEDHCDHAAGHSTCVSLDGG